MKNSMKAIAILMFGLFASNLNGQYFKGSIFDYSFYDLAKRATWKSTTHGTSKVHKLKFGVDQKRIGSARNLFKKMEDGRVRGVLHTHPKWTSNGVIRGYFPSIKRLPSNLRLTGSIGFIKPPGKAKTDGARFFIYVKYFDPASRKYKNVKIFDYYKRYNGKLKRINIDLSRFAGKKASFELRVDTGKKAVEDWAAWYNMHIHPKNQAPPKPPKRPTKIQKAVNSFLYGPNYNEVKLFGHHFNFWKTVKVKKEGSNTVVTGRFSHAIKWARNDKYFFTAKFNSKGNLISFKRKIEEGFAIVTPIIKYVANELVGKLPVVGGAIHVTDSHIDYLARAAQGRLKSRPWEEAADEIAFILAIAALSK